MSTVKHRDERWHRGAGLGVCPKRESVYRKARKANNALKQRFSIPILTYPRSAYFACLSLLTHQLVRTELRAWTVCPYTVSIAPYSLSRGNPLKFAWCVSMCKSDWHNVRSYLFVNVRTFRTKMSDSVCNDLKSIPHSIVFIHVKFRMVSNLIKVYNITYLPTERERERYP